MKKLMMYLVFLSLMTAACSEDEDGPVTISKQIEIEDETEVSVPESVLTPTVSITEEIELDDDDFDDFGDIDDIEEIVSSIVLDSINFEIDDYDGADGIEIVNATLKILDANDDELVSFIMASDNNPINLKQFDDMDIVLSPTLSGEIATAIAQSFLEDQYIKLKLDAEFSETPVDFELETIIFLTVSGSPL